VRDDALFAGEELVLGLLFAGEGRFLGLNDVSDICKAKYFFSRFSIFFILLKIYGSGLFLFGCKKNKILVY
jgi:hypothetical protein